MLYVWRMYELAIALATSAASVGLVERKLINKDMYLEVVYL